MASENPASHDPFVFKGAEQLRQLQQFAFAEMNRQAVERSAPVRAMSDQFAKLLGYHGVEAMQQDDGIGTRTLGYAAPMVASQLAAYMGLSPAAMVTALQNNFSQGGMRMRSTDGTYLPLAGYGPAANMLSHQAWDAVDSYFTHPGGAINLNRTYGATRDDIADTMQAMQQRGMFTGQTAGQVETLTAERLSQLKSGAAASGNNTLFKELSAMSPGDPFVSLDPSMTGKLTTWASDTLKGVQDLRALMGNLPVGQIISELERLTGVNVAVPNGVSNAVRQLQNRVATGMSGGLSAQGSLEFASATNSTLDQMLAMRTNAPTGSYINASAQMGGAVDRMAMAAYNEQRQAGGLRQPGEIATRLSSDLSRLLTESPEAVEATYALGMFAPGSKPHSALQASIEAFGSAGSVQQREEARLNMARVLREQTGLRSGALTANIGTGEMLDNISLYHPEALSQLSDTLMRTNQATQIGDWRQVMGMLDENSPLIRGTGGSSNAAAMAQAIFQTIPADARVQIQNQLNSGGMTAAQATLSQYNLPGFGNAYSALSGINQGIMDAGGSGAGAYMTYVNNMGQTHPGLMANTSAASLQQAKSDRQTYEQAAIEYHGSNPLTAGQQLEQGFFGGDIPIEDKLLLQYGRFDDNAKNIGHLKFNKAGGSDVNAEQLGDIKALWTKLGGSDKDIGRALGLGRDAKDEDIIKALSTGDGLRTLTGMLGSKKGAIIGFGEGEEGKGGSGVAFALDPEKLREEHAKERDRAQKAGDESQKSSNQTPQPGGGNPVQINLDIGGTVMSFLGKMFGLKP